MRAAVCFVALALAVLALPFVPPFNEAFRLTQLQLAAAVVTIVLGLNLLTGYSGQISLGHSGFVLLGAYIVGALLSKGFLGVAVHPTVAVLAAAAGAGILGYLVGLPALRLSGPYLVIVTLGLALALPVLMKWDPLHELTGGATGLVIRQPRAPLALEWLTDAMWRYYVIAVPTLVVGWVTWRLTHGRFGRALRALRDHELAAEQVGVNLARHKTQAFAISAAFAGLGGALFSYASLGLVTPDSFGIFDSLDYVTAIVVGGVGTVSGSVIGGLLVAYQKQITAYLLAPVWTLSIAGSEVVSMPSPFSVIDRPEPLRPAVYGAMLVLVVLLAPRGIAGLLEDLARRLLCRATTQRAATRARSVTRRRRPLPDFRK